MADNVVRKRATRKVATKTVRKAPTRTESGGEERRNLMPFVAIAVFVLVIGVSVAVGFSDDGEINIEGTINERRISGTDEEKAALQNIPVQRKRPSAPNGGLVPTTDPNPDSVPKPPVEETASTTATSTDEVLEDGETATTEENTDGASSNEAAVDVTTESETPLAETTADTSETTPAQ